MNQVITLYDYRVSKKFGGSIPLSWDTAELEVAPIYNDPLIYLADFIKTFKLPQIKIPSLSTPEIALPEVRIDQKIDWLTQIIEDDLFSLLDKAQISWEKLMDNLTFWNYRLGGLYYSFEGSYLKREQVSSYLKNLSIACLAFSLIGLSLVSAPVVVSELKYGVIPSIQHASKLQTEGKITNTLITKTQPPVELPQNINDFSISIPKINLEAKVIPEVDPNNEQEYSEKLKQGVAQAKGSYLPGQGGTTLLFSHSTDSIFDISKYDALFYGVKDLKDGDEIKIYFEGKEYRYKMIDRKIISPTDLTSLKNTKADLILSTCYPPGTNWQRLLVFAKEV